MMLKKIKQFEIDSKNYHLDYKIYSTVVKKESYEIYLSRHAHHQQKYLHLKVPFIQPTLVNIQHYMTIVQQFRQSQYLMKCVGFTLLKQLSKKSKQKSMVIIYQFVENSLYDLINHKRCKNKEQSLGMVSCVLQSMMRGIIEIQDVRGVDLNCICFDSKMIGFNQYACLHQQIKILYFPFELLTKESIFQRQFKRQVYSARQLRQINKLQSQHQRTIYTQMDFDNIILQSQRQTQNQTYNRYILQKIGLFVFKLLYILCQDIDLKQQEFNLYTINESFIIDFNWNLINQFLQECYRHKDYVQIATIIRFLISDCQEENTFEYYYEKVNEIKINLPAAKKQNYVEQDDSLNSRRKSMKRQQMTRSLGKDMLMERSGNKDEQLNMASSMYQRQNNQNPYLNKANPIKRQDNRHVQMKIQQKNYIQRLNPLLFTLAQPKIKNISVTHKELDHNHQKNLLRVTNYNTKAQSHLNSSRHNISNRLQDIQQFILNHSKIIQIPYSDSSKYAGQLNQKGQRHGLGLYYFVQGQIYGGQWKNNQMTGKGIYLFTNQEEIYEGQVLCGIKSGFGIYHYKNNNEYKGQWRHDVKEGYGQLKDYSSRQIYSGQFKNNHKHGQGVIIYHDGSKFEGHFINGMKQGQGLFYDKENRLYFKSLWSNDSMETYGEIFFNNGDYYNGQIRNYLMHGKGLYKYINGTVYQGDFIDNCTSGQCIIHYDNGDIYQGRISMGLLQGKGKYHYSRDNLQYEGAWKGNKQQGQASYTMNDHNKLICTIQSGQIISYTMYSPK